MFKIKPMKARDWIPSKVVFPCFYQPKYDGVRALNLDGKLVARTLKPHNNRYITEKYSKPEYKGFDGEMILTELGPCHPDVCRETSGAIRREHGEPDVTWYVFDYITEETINLPYSDRFGLLEEYVEKLNDPSIKVVTTSTCFSMEEFEELDSHALELGYEGSMLKSIKAKYKEGRSDKYMQVWRVKRFIQEECLVTSIEEGNSNQNEAKINELGHTERSSHQENMQPNGQVGKIHGILLKDVKDPVTGKILITKGTNIIVGPGEMSLRDRIYIFENQDIIMNKVIVFKMFPKGIKDKPRFPTYSYIWGTLEDWMKANSDE